MNIATKSDPHTIVYCSAIVDNKPTRFVVALRGHVENTEATLRVSEYFGRRWFLAAQQIVQVGYAPSIAVFLN